MNRKETSEADKSASFRLWRSRACGHEDAKLIISRQTKWNAQGALTIRWIGFDFDQAFVSGTLLSTERLELRTSRIAAEPFFAVRFMLQVLHQGEFGAMHSGGYGVVTANFRHCPASHLLDQTDSKTAQ